MSKMMKIDSKKEQGFTLIEALVAMLILVVGLVSIANLFFLAQSANKVANHQTTAVALATDVMERLKAIPFRDSNNNFLLLPNDTTAGAPSIGGGFTAQPIDMTTAQPNVGNISNCVDNPGSTAPNSNCVVPGNYHLRRTVPGVGNFLVRWQIVSVVNGGDVYLIRVAAETGTRLLGGRANVELSTFRMGL